MIAVLRCFAISLLPCDHRAFERFVCERHASRPARTEPKPQPRGGFALSLGFRAPLLGSAGHCGRCRRVLDVQLVERHQAVPGQRHRHVLSRLHVRGHQQGRGHCVHRDLLSNSEQPCQFRRNGTDLRCVLLYLHRRDHGGVHQKPLLNTKSCRTQAFPARGSSFVSDRGALSVREIKLAFHDFLLAVAIQGHFVYGMEVGEHTTQTD